MKRFGKIWLIMLTITVMLLAWENIQLGYHLLAESKQILELYKLVDALAEEKAP